MGKSSISAAPAASKNSKPTPRDISASPPHNPPGCNLGMPAAAKSVATAGIARSIPRTPKPTSATVYVCPMCPEVRETSPSRAQSAAWHSNQTFQSPRHARSTPARCIPRSCAPSPARVRSAAWRLSRAPLPHRPEENPELRDMTRRFWVSVALTAPLLAIAMGSMFWIQAGCHPQFDGFSIDLAWHRVRARDSGRTLVRPAVLPALLGVARKSQPEHVHSDWARHRRRLRVQRCRNHRAAEFFPSSLRKMGGYPDVYFEAAAAITYSRSSRTGDGIPRAQPHQRRDSCITRSHARRPRVLIERGRLRERYFARTRKARRPPARSSRRKNSGRRRRARRPQLHR